MGNGARCATTADSVPSMTPPFGVDEIVIGEQRMNSQERWLLAIILILIDVVAIFVPLTAILVAYLLIARPPWFREWAERLYS